MICENDILKSCHGQYGDELILSSYNGKTYLRRKPRVIRISSAMVEQGERISGVAALWQSMKSAGIHQIWQKMAVGTGLTAYNMVVKHCQRAFNGQGVISDFEKLKLSVGNLALPDHLNLAYNATDEVGFTWEASSGNSPWANGTDLFIIACMRRADNFIIKTPHIGMFRRKDGHASIRLKDLPANLPHLFCYFQSEDGREYSESRYCSNLKIK